MRLSKERDCKSIPGIFAEVIAYKTAYNFLGLNHTLPATVAKKFKHPDKMRTLLGTLHFYISLDLSLYSHIGDHLNISLKNKNILIN